jgi:hypothetical protein
MRFSKVSAMGAAALALAGCQGRYLPVDDAGHTTAAAPAVAAQPAPTVAQAPDTCGAGKLQYLIGKPKTEIPVAVDIANRRVVCSTCMATADVRPERLDILFDSVTGKVTTVRCG